MKKPGSGSIWIRILLALLDPDLELYIVKVLDPDPYLEYGIQIHTTDLYLSDLFDVKLHYIYLIFSIFIVLDPSARIRYYLSSSIRLRILPLLIQAMDVSLKMLLTVRKFFVFYLHTHKP